MTVEVSALAVLVGALGWTLVHFLWQGGLVWLWWSVALRAGGSRQGVSLAALSALTLLPVVTFGVMVPRVLESERLQVVAGRAQASLTQESLARASFGTERSLSDGEVVRAVGTGLGVGDRRQLESGEHQPDATAIDSRESTASGLATASDSAPLSATVQKSLTDVEASATRAVAHGEGGLFQSITGWMSERVQRWRLLIIAGWVCGVLMLSLRLALQWLGVSRWVREAERVGGQWQLRVAELAERLGCRVPVALLESRSCGVPLTVGVWRPVVLLPCELLTQLPPGQIEAILLHELAHVRRFDFAVNLWQTLMETLFFYHPVVWRVSREIREEREYRCDAVAAAACPDVADYAHSLLALEGCCGTLGAELPLSAASRSPGELLRRMQRLASGSGEAGTLPGVVLASVMLLVVSGLALWSVTGWPTVVTAGETAEEGEHLPGEDQAAGVREVLGRYDVMLWQTLDVEEMLERGHAGLSPDGRWLGLVHAGEVVVIESRSGHVAWREQRDCDRLGWERGELVMVSGQETTRQRIEVGTVRVDRPGELSRGCNALVVARVGYADRGASWVGHPDRERLVSLAGLSEGDHLVMAQPHPAIWTLTVPPAGGDERFVELKRRFAGAARLDHRHELDVQVQVENGGEGETERVSVAIENRSGEDLAGSELDLRLETEVGRRVFQVYSPAWSHGMPREFRLKRGERVELSLDWQEWIQQGVWVTGGVQEGLGPWPVGSEPERVWVRVVVGKTGAAPVSLAEPVTSEEDEEGFTQRLEQLQGLSHHTVRHEDWVAGYERLISDFPQHPRRAEAMFDLAHVWALTIPDQGVSKDRGRTIEWLRRAHEAAEVGSVVWVTSGLHLHSRIYRERPAEAAALLESIQSATGDVVTKAKVESARLSVAVHEGDRERGEEIVRSLLDLLGAPESPQGGRERSELTREVQGASSFLMTQWEQAGEQDKIQRLVKDYGYQFLVDFLFERRGEGSGGDELPDSSSGGVGESTVENRSSEAVTEGSGGASGDEGIDQITLSLYEQYVARAGKIETENVRAAIQLVSRRGARDERFIGRVLDDLRAAGGDLTVRRNLLSVLSKVNEVYGGYRWSVERSGVTGLPQQTAVVMSEDGESRLSVIEQSIAECLLEQGRGATRSDIDHFVIALRQLHHEVAREFFLDVLATEGGRGAVVESAKGAAVTGEDKKPRATWSDEVGGSWWEARFHAAVGLAELGDPVGVEWLLQRARPSEFGLDDSVDRGRHAGARSDSLRESCRLALADLAGWSKPFEVAGFEAWWEEQRASFAPGHVSLRFVLP